MRGSALACLPTSATLENANEDEGDDDVDHERVHVAALEGMAADKGDDDGGENDGDESVHGVPSFLCRDGLESAEEGAEDDDPQATATFSAFMRVMIAVDGDPFVGPGVDVSDVSAHSTLLVAWGMTPVNENKGEETGFSTTKSLPFRSCRDYQMFSSALFVSGVISARMAAAWNARRRKEKSHSFPLLRR